MCLIVLSLEHKSQEMFRRHQCVQHRIPNAVQPLGNAGVHSALIHSHGRSEFK